MSNILEVIKGSKLRVENNCVVVKVSEEERSIPVSEIEVIVIENTQVSITAAVNILCSQADIPIIYCDEKFTPVAQSLSFNKYYQQSKRIKEQIKWSEEKKNELFVKIIKSKIENQVLLLEYFDLTNKVEMLREMAENITKENVESKEALVARVYFKELFGSQFTRFSEDELNHSLNYGYAILRSIIKQQIVAKGLEPSLGIWHHSIFNNYNLADDIIEVYRPMVDYIVYLLIIKDGSLMRDERETLQKVAFQKVTFGKVTIDFKQSLKLYLDQIISFMNNEINNISLPKVEGKNYEY